MRPIFWFPDLILKDALANFPGYCGGHWPKITKLVRSVFNIVRSGVTRVTNHWPRQLPMDFTRAKRGPIKEERGGGIKEI